MTDINVFLDDAAMNVAEWPTDYEKVGCQVLSVGIRGPIWGVDFDGNVIVFGRENAGRITKDQWLQRRKELINEPDDADAPEWAKWKAQDSCGRWYWRDERPTIGDGMWDDDGDWSGSNNGKIPAGHDWRKTLRQVHKQTATNQGQLKDLCHLLDTTQDEWVKEVLRIVIAKLVCKQYGLDDNEIIKHVVQ